jgi:hypothetical protein
MHIVTTRLQRVTFNTLIEKVWLLNCILFCCLLHGNRTGFIRPHSAMYKSSPGLAAPVSRIAYLQVFWQFTLATGMMPLVHRTIVQCVP